MIPHESTLNDKVFKKRKKKINDIQVEFFATKS